MVFSLHKASEKRYTEPIKHRRNAMKKAEWILRSHREHLATLKLLKASLRQIGEITNAEKNDHIEGKGSGTYSPTGCRKIPHRSAEPKRLPSPMTNTFTLSAQAMPRICLGRFYPQVYDAMIARLIPDEMWLARGRRFNGKFLGRMLLGAYASMKRASDCVFFANK